MIGIEVIIGFMGMFLILLAFFMNQIRKWKTENPVYDIVNFIGALLLIIYSYLIRSWPFLVLNLVWLIVSFREAFVDIKKSEKGSIGHKKK